METTLQKFEDTVKLSHGMTGKLAIEVKVSDKDENTAMERAFKTLEAAKGRARAHGYTI